MKIGAAFLVLLALPCTQASEVNPIEKVLQMLQDLQFKVLKEGEDAHKVYTEFAEFCEDRAQKLGFEIKDGKAQKAELESTIESETATISALESKIEELSSDIGTAENELKAATKIREKEHAEYAVEERELKETIDSLERAISILTKEMAKANGASMLQLRSASSVTQALSVLVQAAAISTEDGSKLTALVQQSQKQASDEEDEDSDSDSDEPGAPAGAVYKGHSDGIIATLEGLLDKAEAQLDKARKAESTSKHNYEMLKQSLTDEMSYAETDMDAAKKGLAESQEHKSVAEGDLATTTADLEADHKAKEELHHECMSGAQDYEEQAKSRNEELKALQEAKKVIKESTGGATEQTYGLNQVDSFVQLTSRADLSKFEAVRFVRDLSKRHHSTMLAQLASRMNSAIRLGNANGADPFAKVEGLIKDMIATLEVEAEEDATHHAYCEKEMSETAEKQQDKEDQVEKLTTKIDQNKARSTKLKEQVRTLQSELADMAKAQAEATKLREEEHAAYKTNKAEMEQGLRGVRVALKVLKEYYAKGDKAHDANEGAGAGIIGLLEVVESDFSKGLAEMVAEEETAAAEYKEFTKANEVDTAAKIKDVQYKTQEAKALDKSVAEMSTDLSGVQTELDAINEYDAKIKKECVAKAEPYEERKQRREEEIAGLKQALTILDGVSLLQRTSKHTLRGAHKHQ
jgi:hypothetical protein